MKTKKKYEDGGDVVSKPRKSKSVVISPSGNYKTITKSSNIPEKAKTTSSQKTVRTIKGVRTNAPKVESAENGAGKFSTKKGIGIQYGDYKTGGMVNSNAKVSASKVARGRVGGISSAPKTAVPKAMYGMSVKPSMMRKGGANKK